LASGASASRAGAKYRGSATGFEVGGWRAIDPGFVQIPRAHEFPANSRSLQEIPVSSSTGICPQAIESTKRFPALSHKKCRRGQNSHQIPV
jgi:hypothetical protein